MGISVSTDIQGKFYCSIIVLGITQIDEIIVDHNMNKMPAYEVYIV